MKGIILLPIAFSLMSNALATTCQYPLDASSSQYSGYDSALSGTDYPFPAISNQDASLTIAPTSDGVNYVAFTSATFDTAATAISNNGYIGDISLPTTGIVGFEFQVTDFAVSPNAADGVVLTASLSTLPLIANRFRGFSAELSLYSNNNNTVAVLGGYSETEGLLYSTSHHSLSLPSSTRFGIYLNMSTRRIGYTLNGTDMGYVINELPSNSADQDIPIYFGSDIQNIAIVVGARTSVSSTSPILGATVGGSLITDSSQFTQPFPSGTKDICGNPIP